MMTFSFTTEVDTEKYGTVTIEASGTISKYYPATMYRSNGDPGDPEEGGDVEYDELSITDENGNECDYEPDYDRLDELAREHAN